MKPLVLKKLLYCCNSPASQHDAFLCDLEPHQYVSTDAPHKSYSNLINKYKNSWDGN